MFCTYCGAQNLDDYNFCYKCGKPRRAVGQAVSHETSSQNTPDQSIDVAFVRGLFLSAAREYENNKSEYRKKEISPFQLLDLDAHMDKIVLLRNVSKQQVDELVFPNRFSEAEKQLCCDGMVYLTYLDMLRICAGTIESTTLLQGAFWGDTLVRYNSQLKSLAENKEWRDYNTLTTQYLEEARETKAAICLIRALVKAAHAKLMLGDRPTCRAYLDEFDRTVGAALRETPAYPFPGNPKLFNEWVKACQEEANRLKAQAK